MQISPSIKAAWNKLNGVDAWYFGLSIVLFAVAAGAMYMREYPCFDTLAYVVALGIAGLVDVYILILLLFQSSNKSKLGEGSHIQVPHKPVALLVLLFLFFAMVTSFAVIYLATGTVAPADALNTHIDSARDALYFSATSILWLTPENLCLQPGGRWIFLWELGSTILYIFIAFPVMTTLMTAKE